MNANQHVDRVVDFNTRWIDTLKFLLAYLAKMTLNRVEAIGDKIIGIFLALDGAVVLR